MKKVFYFAVLIFALTSCAKWRLVTITATQKQNEISIMPDLQNFLRENEKISVVLRVPNTQSMITKETRNTELYNQVEKKLLNEGFYVIDRTLLENLVTRGNVSYSDYAEIGKKLKADIIIEITDELYEIDTKYEVSGKIKKIGKFGVIDKTHSYGFVVNQTYLPFKVYTSKFSFRIVSVKEGATRGYLTFYYTPCTDGCNTYAYKVGRRDYDCCHNTKGGSDFDFYNVSYDYILEDIPNKIINALRINVFNKSTVPTQSKQPQPQPQPQSQSQPQPQQETSIQTTSTYTMSEDYTVFEDIELMVINKELGTGSWYEAKNKCYELNTGGYNDWYLPSKNELEIILNKIKKDVEINISFKSVLFPWKMFQSFWYWSSTEISDKKAYNISKSGWVSEENKNKKVDCFCVRKIR